jgi:hypothetical protein
MSDAPDHEAACFDVIRNTIPLLRLAEFAIRRVSYGNSDRGCGLDYGDLGDGRVLPPGQILIYDFWGPPDGYEVIVPEAVYLSVLAQVLYQNGFAADAEQVQRLSSPGGATDGSQGCSEAEGERNPWNADAKK